MGRSTLSLVMNEQGGIVDDCIISRIGDKDFFVVINAGCIDKDLEHFKKY